MQIRQISPSYLQSPPYLGGRTADRLNRHEFSFEGFKAYASKFAYSKNHKKQDIFSRKPPKNAPKIKYFRL